AALASASVGCLTFGFTSSWTTFMNSSCFRMRSRNWSWLTPSFLSSEANAASTSWSLNILPVSSRRKLFSLTFAIPFSSSRSCIFIFCFSASWKRSSLSIMSSSTFFLSSATAFLSASRPGALRFHDSSTAATSFEYSLSRIGVPLTDATVSSIVAPRAGPAANIAASSAAAHSDDFPTSVELGIHDLHVIARLKRPQVLVELLLLQNAADTLLHHRELERLFPLLAEDMVAELAAYRTDDLPNLTAEDDVLELRDDLAVD